LSDAPDTVSGAERPLTATAGSIPCSLAAFDGLSAGILRDGVAVRFRAHGASMAPLVRDGDVLLVRPVAASSLRVGDVVLCASGPGCVAAHRVVRMEDGAEGPCFTVQGDAVAQPDGVIPPAQIYGRVVAIERGGTSISLDRPAMRLFGRAAALRSRRNLARGARSRQARRLVKRLPVLNRYLA